MICRPHQDGQLTANSILDEYIIISPLWNRKNSSLYAPGNISPYDKLECFAQLLEAVALLRQHGIWHRDIKPDNILVRSSDPPGVMLTGFECASNAMDIAYDDKTGTGHYLAPEQVEGKTHNQAVD
jgi:serine/threonine protein kinase